MHPVKAWPLIAHQFVKLEQRTDMNGDITAEEQIHSLANTVFATG